MITVPKHVINAFLLGALSPCLVLGQAGARWIANQGSLPAGATMVNNLAVCRAGYQNGIHPGSVQQNGCMITWGGQAVLIPQYDVLVAQGNWAAPKPGFTGAFPAGSENSGALYLCRAMVGGTTVPGKVVSGACNVAYQGQERAVKKFDVFYQLNLRELRELADQQKAQSNSSSQPGLRQGK
ncbi:MAG TPA: DM9 repeat-containing protein [Bryobacteraceae bacterium]|nr:DM9 repeat-containing protein [Bryobacteraceae bacterium]